MVGAGPLSEREWLGEHLRDRNPSALTALSARSILVAALRAWACPLHCGSSRTGPAATRESMATRSSVVSTKSPTAGRYVTFTESRRLRSTVRMERFLPS